MAEPLRAAAPLMGDFYSTPEWRRVRVLVLDRDGHRCQIGRRGCAGVADEVDHVVPWRDGGAKLDPSNLRAACAPCNRGRANTQKANYGWRRSQTRVVLVVGPPGAGKSTLVQAEAGPLDVIVDYDTISSSFGKVLPIGSGHRHDVTMAARNAVLTMIRRGEVDAPRAWVVSTNPMAEAMFPHHEVRLVDPGRDEVLRRCVKAGRPASFLRLVDDWYAQRAGEVGASREW